MNKRSLTMRFFIGPAAIVAVFFFLEKTRPFNEVWKPLLLYFALAVPAFFLVDYLKKKNVIPGAGAGSGSAR
jgi:hypothetical protein